jgi:hypothetical protein
MSIIFISIAKIRDWQAVERLSNEIVIDQAREAGATLYRVYRNVNNAAQGLVMIEFPSYSDLYRGGDKGLSAQVNILFEGSVSDDRVWELTDFDRIG